MPGTLNVGGHNIITHSGTSGAGTINLVDQAGNTILTDSGSGMSLNSNVAFPAGHVLQVVQTQLTNGTSISTNSGTPIATGVIATLPSLQATTNKIYISLNGGESDCNGAGNRYLYFYHSIAGGTYTVTHPSSFGQYIGHTATSRFPCSIQWLYSPNTTQQVSIQVYMHVSANTIWLTNGRHLTLTLMEIKA